MLQRCKVIHLPRVLQLAAPTPILEQECWQVHLKQSYGEGSNV